MTAVTTLVVTYSRTELLANLGDRQLRNDFDGSLYNTSFDECSFEHYDMHVCPLPDKFVNASIFFAAIIIVLMGIFRVGEYIGLVPNVVISGFMNGIAVQIWQKEVIKIWHTIVGGTPQIKGSPFLNIPIIVITTALCFILPKLIRRCVPPKIAKSLPATLCVIILVTVVCLVFPDCSVSDDDLCVEKTKLGATLDGFQDLKELVRRQWPIKEDLEIPGVLWGSLAFAAQLAPLCYLDTLLTCLVVDKMVQDQEEGSDRQTRKNQRLASLGLGNGLVATFGGLPGAQATIRSVLILKEGGTMSLAGGAAGVFVMFEMMVFKELVKLIPKAVFSGILFKVGYEVFDFTPISIYLKKYIESSLDTRRSTDALKRRHLKASRELAAYDPPDPGSSTAKVIGAAKQIPKAAPSGTSVDSSLVASDFDSEATLFVPTNSKQHARAKVQRYAHALTARGEEAEDWSNVEQSDEAVAERVSSDPPSVSVDYDLLQCVVCAR